MPSFRSAFTGLPRAHRKKHSRPSAPPASRSAPGLREHGTKMSKIILSVLILACIAVGALISAMVAPPALTLASVAAFSASETGDWLVYSRLRRSGLTIAILAAGVVGSIIDSGLFVTIAFGLSFWLIAGQFIAKVWSTLFAAGITLAFALKCRDIKTVTRAS